MDRKRKLAFFEVGSGRLARDVQKAFEHAQQTCNNAGVTTEVNLKIILYPSKDGKFGQLEYRVSEKLPPQKSLKYTTQINPAGVILSDGTDKVDTMQEELFINEPTIHKLTNEEAG